MSESVTITIKIDPDGITCESNLGAPDLVYWLEVMKKVILEDHMDPPETK